MSVEPLRSSCCRQGQSQPATPERQAPCGRRANPLRREAPPAVADSRTAAQARRLAFAMLQPGSREQRAHREDPQPSGRRDSAGSLAFLRRQQAFPPQLALFVLRALRWLPLA